MSNPGRKAMQPQTELAIELATIGEFFSAPACNPFSSRLLDVLGESGLDLLRKHAMRRWPRRPERTLVVLRLPAAQIRDGLEAQTRLALRRYCDERIRENQNQRRSTIQTSIRQMGLAFIFYLFILLIVILLASFGGSLLPEILVGVITVILLFAGSVAVFDALWSLVFDWLPYTRENRFYRYLRGVEISLQPVEAAR